LEDSGDLLVFQCGFGRLFHRGFGHDAFDEEGDGTFAFGGLAYFGARGEDA
jgi:hypothetical protein